VVVVDELLLVQNKSYDRPTVLIAKRVKGEEEIPDGVVGVITPDMPDVLSHVSVRARNCKVLLFSSQLYCNLCETPFLLLTLAYNVFLPKVLFATCFDPSILSELEGHDWKLLSFKPTSVDVSYRCIKLLRKFLIPDEIPYTNY
jgi:alpha-glucan, water dikinase